MANEKVMMKIKNLLDLANNNPNENEAIAAALKAQELMAKYDIELDKLDEKVENREIVEEIYFETGKHNMKKWKLGLATIVANNFKCKVYFLGKKDVVFYGYKEDAKIALSVFTYLYEAGNKFAVRAYNKEKKAGNTTKGVMNTYLIGFRDGIKSRLEKQCTALMIVTPEEIKEKFCEKINTENFKTINSNVKYNGKDDVYKEGFTDGKSVADARTLEAAS